MQALSFCPTLYKYDLKKIYPSVMPEYVTLRKAKRFRLDPTAEQDHLLSKAVGCVRFVWNRALAIQKSYLNHQCGILTYNDLAECLTSWRNSEAMGFLAESPSQTQQQTLRNLDRAFKDAFDKSSVKQFPKFKKKGRHDSMRFPAPDQLKFDLIKKDNQGRNLLPKIYLPMIGWVKFRKSCTFGGEIRNATVSRSGGHWYVSVQVEQIIVKPVHPSSTAVGGDLGVASFLTLSDGTVFAPISAYRAVQDRLAKEQRRLSKKIKFSSNWKKQKSKISKIYERIGHIRKDVLHKVSTTISKSHAVVVLEDLKVQNMTKSGHSRSKTGLNKSILDQGWGLFRQMVGYKQDWLGGMLISTNSAYTSQTCSKCGYVDTGNRPTQSVFKCLKCGHTEHADSNASKNIRNKGLTAGHAGIVCSPV